MSDLSGPSCYLCSEPLGLPISADHVPPKQFFAPSIRKSEPNIQLLTIPVHDLCNKAYQHDEDYFVHTFAPFAAGSVSGDAIYRRILSQYAGGRGVGLTRAILREFDPRPSGLHLPGKVLKRFDGDRVWRVGWKIVRGLHFHHHSVILSPRLGFTPTVTPPGQRPPDHFLMFNAVPGNPSLGRHPGVFDYRYQCFQDAEAMLHYWAWLLWDRLIFTFAFHDPECRCQDCLSPQG